MGTEKDDVRGIGFVAPSVTPLMFEGGVNPSVRVYDYDPENRVIIDYETVRSTRFVGQRGFLLSPVLDGFDQLLSFCALSTGSKL